MLSDRLVERYYNHSIQTVLVLKQTVKEKNCCFSMKYIDWLFGICCRVDNDCRSHCVFFGQLPLDLQERVKAFLTKDERLKLEMSDEDAEATTVRVPMSTFPPTAIYSAPSNQPGGKKQHGSEGDLGKTVPMDAIAKALMQNEDTRLLQPRKMQTCYLCRKHASTYKNVDEQSQTTDALPPFSGNTSVSQQDQSYMGSCPPGVHKASRGLLLK